MTGAERENDIEKGNRENQKGKKGEKGGRRGKEMTPVGNIL